jgi:hypothetical protein
MRVERVQPKQLRDVPIPLPLRSALREVHSIIEEAERDPDIDISYDDAIQAPGICGGRYGSEPRPFILTFYPRDDYDRDKWFLELGEIEIEDIADGVITHLPMHCCTSPECHTKFSDPSDTCFYCDYTDDPSFGAFSFPDALQKLRDMNITTINDSSIRDDVLQALGNPDKSGGGDTIHGHVHPWIFYRRPDCQLRFEFENNGHLRSVSFFPSDWSLEK